MIEQRAGSFWLKLGAGLAVAAIFDAVLFGWQQGGGLLGVLELLLLTAPLALRPALRRNRGALACFGVASVMAAAMIFDPGLLAWCLFWTFASLGAMLPGAARFGDAWAWGQRLAWQALRAGLAPAFDLRRWFKLRHRSGGGQVRSALPHLVLPAIGGAMILGLFAAANPVIEIALDRILSLSPREDLFLRLSLGVVWFTFAWSLLRPRMARRLIGTFDGSGDLALPGVTPASVRLSLILFNALFALQNAMDLIWLWGLAPLPKGMTLAEYAHRGAYPLIMTALLAGGFVLVALRPGSQTAAMPLVRRLVVVWIAQNVLLVANAALRTLDYVAAYSLTQMRIAALLWMALVALGLVLVLWRMLRGNSASWLINTNAAAALTLLGACSFVDLDAVSAQYNIAHARELGGGGAALDVCYLQQMGPSALVALAELEQRPAPEPIHLWARLLRENVQSEVASNLAHGNWSLLGEIRLAEVRARLGTTPLKLRGQAFVPCDVRDVHTLRIALGLEQAPPALPVPDPATTPTPTPAPVPDTAPHPAPLPAALTEPVKP